MTTFRTQTNLTGTVRATYAPLIGSDLVLAIWVAFPDLAEPRTCPGSRVSVSASNSENADLACEAVSAASALFETCGIPTFAQNLKIVVDEDLTPNCVALYHCDEDWIEVLAPARIEMRLAPKAAFAFLTPNAYFQSLVVHELAHAALDDIPCPIETCIVAQEYATYNMQVMSLRTASYKTFAEAFDDSHPVTSDEITSITLFMTPDLFARRAWAPLRQQSDPCGFVTSVSKGEVKLDYDWF